MKQNGLFDFDDQVNYKTQTDPSPEPGKMGVQDDFPEIPKLHELCVDAYFSVIYAWMSELPIKKEIGRYIDKIIQNGADRTSAARTAFDRGDQDVITVLGAAYKVQREIHRLLGLLRFTLNSGGIYTARCAPDHYILPAMAEHFTLRFGETPWAIIDEKRNICLIKNKNEEVQLMNIPACFAANNEQSGATGGCTGSDAWEDLWRLYHKSVNNEARKNLTLQRQFMPVRYQKYLTELN